MDKRALIAAAAGAGVLFAIPSLAGATVQDVVAMDEEQGTEDGEWEPNVATRIVCRSVAVPTGSRLPRTRNICLTESQWRSRQSDVYQSLENSGLRNRGNF